jgi:hypothetical protein
MAIISVPPLCLRCLCGFLFFTTETPQTQRLPRDIRLLNDVHTSIHQGERLSLTSREALSQPQCVAQVLI